MGRLFEPLGPMRHDRMNRQLFMALAIDAAFILLLLIIPAHAYEWMIESGLPPKSLPDDPLRDIRLLLTGIVLIAVLFFHLLAAMRLGLIGRLLHVTSAIGLTLAWAWKFYFQY